MSSTRLPPNLGAHSRRVTELFRPLPLAERLADSLILLLRYVDAAGIAAYASTARSSRHCLRLAPLLASLSGVLAERAAVCLSTYAVGLSPLSLVGALSVLGEGDVTAGELALPEEGEGEGDAAETTAPPESQQAQDHCRPRPASSSKRAYLPSASPLQQPRGLQLQQQLL